MYIGIAVSIGGMDHVPWFMWSDPGVIIRISCRCMRVLGEFPRSTSGPDRSFTVAEGSAETRITNLSRSVRPGAKRPLPTAPSDAVGFSTGGEIRSEEHTSELQSQSNLVC